MIKFILTQGIGFTPSSIKYMPMLGFSPAAETFGVCGNITATHAGTGSITAEHDC